MPSVRWMQNKPPGPSGIEELNPATIPKRKLYTKSFMGGKGNHLAENDFIYLCKMNTIGKNFLFSILSGVLLSIPWLFPHTGLLLLFAWVPLLWMEQEFTASGKKGCWKYYALTFLVWNALAVFWIWNITPAGGVFAVVGNAFQMYLIFLLFRLFKKMLLKKGYATFVAYIFLAVLWIAWEHFYFDAEISFPWLVLGNGFANNIRLIQWYEWTGALGGTAWVFLCNVLLFFAFTAKHPKVIYRVAAVCILLPVAGSVIRFYTYEEVPDPVEVVVLQPNIDPTPGGEKFNGLSQDAQDERLFALADQQVTASTDYVFAPETFTQNVVETMLLTNPTLQRIQRFVHRFPNVAFVTGASTARVYENAASRPTPTARRSGRLWYDAFNSAMFMDTTDRVGIYHKSKLVVGAEKMPFVEKFPIVEKMALDLGGTTGSLGTQKNREVFTHAGHAGKVGVAICYESIYGAFFTEYVTKGATLMSVITNDGWWGNTPGYRQHLSYASLRAIETRRSIARSANTGVSALVNQRGERLAQTKWWEPAVLKGTLNLNDKLTFYVRHKDLVGTGASWLMLACVLFWGIMACSPRKRH